jgi:hypothetical protein
MNFRKALSALLLIFVLAVAQASVSSDNGIRSSNDWVNSPTVGFAPNGDRTSPYPPYYHPNS